VVAIALNGPAKTISDSSPGCPAGWGSGSVGLAQIAKAQQAQQVVQGNFPQPSSGRWGFLQPPPRCNSQVLGGGFSALCPPFHKRRCFWVLCSSCHAGKQGLRAVLCHLGGLLVHCSLYGWTWPKLCECTSEDCMTACTRHAPASLATTTTSLRCLPCPS
jgi:hypothetical protein